MSIGIPIFKGRPYQNGYGFGGVFRKLFKWAMPIIKKHALPIAQSVGHSILDGASNIARDAIKGKNIKISANNRFDETLNELSKKAGIFEEQGGQGYIRKRKRKPKYTKKKAKRFKDIFAK